ncbi:MAG: hypothetical protein O3C21_20975, partial [Verrucomicrobia bacterium]|nr:hypothetical protein [Verrucomicrobiota bacterium]
VLHGEGAERFLAFKYPNGMQITHNKPGTGNMRIEGTKEKREPKPTPIPTYADGDGKDRRGSIDGDFLQCVKTRGTPFRSIEHAVNTMALPHLASIAYTLNRSLKWDAAKQQFVGDPEADRLIDTARREPWQI